MRIYKYNLYISVCLTHFVLNLIDNYPSKLLCMRTTLVLSGWPTRTFILFIRFHEVSDSLLFWQQLKLEATIRTSDNENNTSRSTLSI